MEFEMIASTTTIEEASLLRYLQENIPLWKKFDTDCVDTLW